MSHGSLSIKGRLSKSRKPGVRREIVHDWIAGWRRDQFATLDLLGEALVEQDWTRVAEARDLLRALTTKPLMALPDVVDALLDVPASETSAPAPKVLRAPAGAAPREAPRSDQPHPKGPWFITPTAVREYMAIRKRDAEDEDAFGLSLAELIEMAESAVSRQKNPPEQESGALQYRGPGPWRLYLVVMPSYVPGRLPQLIAVRAPFKARP